MQKKKNKLSFFEIIMLVLFLLTLFTGRNVISKLKWEIIILYFIIPFLDIISNNKKIIITKIIKKWIIIAIYSILGIIYSYAPKTSIIYIAILVIGSLFLTYKIDIRVFLEFFKIAKILCVVFAVSNILSSVIVNFIPKYFSFFVINLKPIYIELAGKNYSGLAGEKAVSAFILNIGIGIIYSEILVNGKIDKKNIIFLLILFCGLFLTGKRMLTLIPLVLIFAMYICASEKNKIIKLMKMFSLIVAGIAVLLIVFPNITHVVDRFKDSDDNGRKELWNTCIKMYKDSPIFGQGLGTFNNYNYDIGYRDYDGKKWTYEAHNIYYQILGELGILGFIIIVGTFIYTIMKAIRLLRTEEILKKKKFKYLLYISLYIQFLFVIYGITGNTFYYWHQLYIYLIGVSIINTMIEYTQRKRYLN
jgi:O-antigen polymerase